MIKIIYFGKIKTKPLLALAQEYQKRLTRFAKIDYLEWKETSFEKDNERVLDYMKTNTQETIIIMDEHATPLSTYKFHKQIKQYQEKTKKTSGFLDTAPFHVVISSIMDLSSMPTSELFALLLSAKSSD